MCLNKNMRVGLGYDIHKLEDGLKLIIGGVQINFSKGSKGHSDGDALIHSIVDAILGAVSLGDIGEFFPSSDKKWKNISSSEFLRAATKKIRLMGYEINNIDTNVIIQNPKLLEYKPKIIENLSRLIGIKKNQISLKAKTADYLGYVGNGSGWSSQAIVTIYKNE